MILEELQVKELAKSSTDEWITIAREDSTKLKANYYGKDASLTQIQGIESKDRFTLREDHSISNTFLTENLLRPTDNIWSAKGGMTKIDLDGKAKEEFLLILEDVRNGLSLKKYVKEIWRDKLIADPNGVTYVEVKKEKAYLTQKSIFSIKNMKTEGICPSYIVFEPDLIMENDIPIARSGEIKKQTTKLLWVVDDSFYYRVELKGQEEINIITKIPNSFKIVPGVVNSSIVDTERGLKLSPIWKQIELLEKYHKNNSVKEVYQFLHGFPIFWMYGKKCPTCKGTGFKEKEKCHDCNGSGDYSKKMVTDFIKLNTPSDTDQPILAPNVAGYVQPDLETWREQRTELDWTWNLIYYSHWGTTVEKKDNETATGRFIDVQPVNNRLNTYADITELIHTKLLNLLLTFYHPGKTGHVNYGRRFLIETPDQIWDKYLNAKEKKAPVSVLDQLLEQYYESEYQYNEMMLEYYLKLMRIEPFIHLSTDEVQLLNVSTEQKLAKNYFSDWVKTKMINEIIDQKEEKLKQELLNYGRDKGESPTETASRRIA